MYRNSLFGAAAPIFRMALAAFLGLERKAYQSPLDDPENLGKEIAAGMAYRDYQKDFEAAILRCQTN